MRHPLSFPSRVGALLLSISALSESAAQAGQSAAGAWTVDSIQSVSLGQTRMLRISLPAVYSEESEQSRRYPVAIVLDAETPLFSALVPSLRLLQSPGHSAALPPLIVVGVVSGRTRMWDMLPPSSPELELARPGAGGAAEFTAFMEKELVPWIQARFRAMPYTVIAGHSAGGHFALYALAHSTAFQAAIAVSPAVFWLAPGITDEKLTRQYADLIRRRTDKARLYVAVGDHEPANIRHGTKMFIDQLGRLPSHLVLRYSVLENDNHQTTRQSGVIEGFRWVFDPVSLSRHRLYQMSGPNAIDRVAFLRRYEEMKATYAAGARQLGFRETLPAAFLSQAGRSSGSASALDGPPIAPTICSDYVRLYPDDPWSHECVATIAIRSGDSIGALRHYRAAANVARGGNMPQTAADLERAAARLDSALKRKPH